MAPRRIVFIRPPAGERVRTVAGSEPWRTLPLSTRRELYRIGAEAGWSRGQVKAAYARNEPIGGSRYYQQRARSVIGGRLIPVQRGRPASELSGSARGRIVAEGARQGLSPDEALAQYEQGTFRPFARTQPERIPIGVGRLEFDYDGRIQMSTAELQLQPINVLRDAAGINGKLQKFGDFLNATDGRAFIEFREHDFQDKIDEWANKGNRTALINWLKIPYAEYQIQAGVKVREWMEGGSIRGEEPEFWMYHGKTAGVRAAGRQAA